jgi:hypothetical protein
MRIKYVVVLLLIVIAVVLAIPFIDGYMFKQQYLKMIAARNASMMTKISVDEYNLGWLTSTATLTIKTSNPKGNITINQVIEHGPYPQDHRNNDVRTFAEAMITSDVHLNKKIENFLFGTSNAMTGGGGLMHVLTLVSFTEDYSSYIVIAPFNILLPAPMPGGQQTKVTWQGLSGIVNNDFKHDYHIKKFDINLQGGAFNADGPDESIRIASMSSTAEGDCGVKLFCVGKSELTVPTVIFNTASQSVKISAINYIATSSMDDEDNLNGSLKLLLNRYETTEYTVGPFSFSLNINNINGKELRKINDDIIKASDDVSNDNPQAAQMVLLAQINENLPKIMTPKTSIDQTLDLKTTYGNLSESSKLFWPAATPLPQSAKDFTQVNFHLTARAAASLIDQVIAMMDAKAAAEEPIAAPTPVVINNNGKPLTFDQSLQELVAQGLPQDEVKSLQSLQQKNVAADVFNSYVDSRVAIKLIPETIAPALKHAYTLALANPLANVAANAGANKQLDVWVHDNKITSDTRSALIMLQKQNLSSEIYGASIDDIVASKRLPQELGNQLKTEYDSTTHDSSLGSDSDIAAATAPAAAVGQSRQQFDAAVKQGFIIQEKDDYVVNVVYEKGVLKVNNTEVPLPW